MTTNEDYPSAMVLMSTRQAFAPTTATEVTQTTETAMPKAKKKTIFEFEIHDSYDPFRLAGESYRYALHVVRLGVIRGSLGLEATDGRGLIRIKLPHVAEENWPPEDVFLQKDAAKMLTRKSPKKVSIDMEADELRVECGGKIVLQKGIRTDHKWPDAECVAKAADAKVEGKDSFKMAFDAKRFYAVAQAIREEGDFLIMEFSKDQGAPVRLTSTTNTDATGYLMPVSME
ncbi:MAG: hypothetical protein ACYSW8_32755 [Planctomycetota bacterium]|jgi:hypothetical protein